MSPYIVLGSPIFAAEGSAAVDSSAWSSIISAITNQISVTTVVGVLATIAGASVGLCFMWWGVRKAISSLMAAFKNGKFKVG